MYLRETVAAEFKDAATVSVKLSMVVGMIVSYTVGAIVDDTLFGESCLQSPVYLSRRTH